MEMQEALVGTVSVSALCKRVLPAVALKEKGESFVMQSEGGKEGKEEMTPRLRAFHKVRSMSIGSCQTDPVLGPFQG